MSRTLYGPGTRVWVDGEAGTVVGHTLLSLPNGEVLPSYVIGLDEGGGYLSHPQSTATELRPRDGQSWFVHHIVVHPNIIGKRS